MPTTADGTFIPAFALLVNGSALNAWVKQPFAVVRGGGRRGRVERAGVRRRPTGRARDGRSRRSGRHGARRGDEPGAEEGSVRAALGVSSDAFDAFERAVLERIASDPSGATLGAEQSRPRDAPRRRDARRRGRRRRRCAPSTTEGETDNLDPTTLPRSRKRVHDADDAFACAVAALLREEKAVRMTKTKTPEDAASSSSENEPAFVADVDPRGADALKKSRTKTSCSPKQKKKPEVARGKAFGEKARVLPEDAHTARASQRGVSRRVVRNPVSKSRRLKRRKRRRRRRERWWASDDGDDDEKKHARLPSRRRCSIGAPRCGPC